MTGTESLLEVHDLSVEFLQYTRGLKQVNLKVISSLSIDINPGEVLAVVGSSGSGKSLLAHAILGVLPKNAEIQGEILYRGEKMTPERQAKLRGREICLIPQSVSYLDPLMRVGSQVRNGVKGAQMVEAQRRVFKRYSLGEENERLYPFQLSGGMLRRVLISTAVVNDAKLIIADEPTPGLHPEMLAETLENFKELADEGRSVMLITHDIDAALKIADRIAIFYAGTTVEVAPAGDFTGGGEGLRHPYSKALWKALPQNGFTPIPGAQPYPGELPQGCIFQPRCSLASSDCSVKKPDARDLRGGMVRCIHAS